MYLQALACLMAQPSRESISPLILNSVRFLYCTRLEPARAGITARIFLSFSIVVPQKFAADPRANLAMQRLAVRKLEVSREGVPKRFLFLGTEFAFYHVRHLAHNLCDLLGRVIDQHNPGLIELILTHESPGP